MDSGSLPKNKPEFCWLEPDALVPNPWNPNRMSSDQFKKLKSEIQSRGMILPLVVRPLDSEKKKFQIIDGEHRWKIARELKLKSLPCIVVALDDIQAQLKTIQLNRLRGEDDPLLLARLLRELDLKLEKEELYSLLPYDSFEIDELLKLLELNVNPEEQKKLEQEVKELAKERIFSLVVSEEEKKIIEQAIFLFQNQKEEEISPGSALAQICQAYLQPSRKA